MRRKLFCLLFVIFMAVLASCASPTDDTAQEDMIRPGDMVGEAALRQAVDESEMNPALWQQCSARPDELSEQKSEDCLLPTGPYLFLGFGVSSSNMEETVSIWESLSWEIAINGQPVDLDAFGTIDNPDSRFWNIVLENPGDGRYEIDQLITVAGDPLEEYGLTLNLIFAEPEVVALAKKADTSLPALSSEVVAGQHALYSETADLDYLLYIPESYAADGQQVWPMIISLHGLGPRYSLEVIRDNVLPQKLEVEEDFPFIVVSPRAFRGEYEIWTVEKTAESVMRLLEEIETVLPVDSNRIYLTGVSAGGNGTWEFGLRHPERFAALAPVMGYYDWPFTVPENICDLKGVPVWAFHGALDETVPLDAEQQIVDALEECGGNVQFTVYPEGGHNIEELVYENPDLYTWLLSQRIE